MHDIAQKKTKTLTGSEWKIKMSMAKTVGKVKGQKKGLREAARMYSVLLVLQPVLSSELIQVFYLRLSQDHPPK